MYVQWGSGVKEKAKKEREKLTKKKGTEIREGDTSDGSVGLLVYLLSIHRIGKKKIIPFRIIDMGGSN